MADHVSAARALGVRPARGEEEQTFDELFAEYFTAFKNYLYTQRWIDRLVDELADDDSYIGLCGRSPRRVPPQLPMESADVSEKPSAAPPSREVR